MLPRNGRVGLDSTHGLPERDNTDISSLCRQYSHALLIVVVESGPWVGHNSSYSIHPISHKCSTMRQAVLLTALLSAPLTTLTEPSSSADEVTNIGSRRELLVDHFLIDRLVNVRLVLNRPKDEGVALKFDKPWEGLFCGY